MNTLTAAKPSSKTIFALNTVSNSLFTATYYITSIPLYQTLGGVAGGLFYAPYPYDFYKSRKTYHKVQRDVKALSARTELLNIEVASLYHQWKEGEDKTAARQRLLDMTNDKVIQEVEMNIQVEQAFLSQQVRPKQTAVASRQNAPK